MHENEATPYEAENEAEANNYEAKNEVEAVKFGLESRPTRPRGLNIPGMRCHLARTLMWSQVTLYSGAPVSHRKERFGGRGPLFRSDAVYRQITLSLVAHATSRALNRKPKAES